MKLSDITIGFIEVNTHRTGHTSGSTSGYTVVVHRITGHTGHINHIVDYREIAKKRRNFNENINRGFNEHKTMILVNNVDNVLEPVLVGLGYVKTNLKQLQSHNFMPIPISLVNPYSIIIASKPDMDRVYKPVLELIKNKK